MKLILLLVCLTTAAQFVLCERSSRNERSIYIVDKILNTTSRITNYVKEKGRSLKNFYKVNVNDRISSIFGSNVKTMKEKFNRYIEKAENTTKTIFDYIAPKLDEDEECAEDRSINHMTTPQLISANGYTAESHTITTEDGYILTLHRIPYSKKAATKAVPSKTVLLQHGLLGSSADWVISGPDRGLAFILSDAGYDVWMTNSRGNTYSRAHVNKSIDSFEFWNFTFHEISQHDLPTAIDYVTFKKSGEKIHFVGFSMGTTALFAMLSTKTKYNEVLAAGYALAPIAYMKEIKSPIKLIARFGNNIESFMKLVGAYEFLPRNAAVRYLANHACKITEFEEAMCELTMFIFCGYSKRFDWSLNPLIMAHLPAGASTKVLAHYAQEIRNNGTFQQFDYRTERNMKEYGTEYPPKYELSRITLPIALISGEDDWLSSLSDAKILFNQLRNPIEHYTVPSPDFNHLDFLFSRDASSLVYDKLLQLLRDPVPATAKEHRR